MSNYTRYPDPAGGIKIYPSAIDFPINPGKDGVQAVAADTNTIYIFDTATNSWQAVANPGAAIAIDALNGDVSATGPGVVNATVNSVGGASAGDIASATNDVLAATNLDTPSTLVKRDAMGNFITNSIQLDSLTASRILASDASKNVISLDTTTYPSLTELSYVKGVTSAIQTQINAKTTGPNSSTPTSIPTFADGSGKVLTDASGWRITGSALIPFADGSGDIGGSAIARPGEVWIKNRLNLAALTASRILASNGSRDVISLDTATYPDLTELSYVKGVTSSIQTQLNNKQPFAKVDRITKSADYNLASSDDYIGCDTTLAAITLTLPAANSVPSGKKYIIKDEGGNAGTFSIFIAPSGTDTIDGVNASENINVGYESLTLVCNGADAWFII